MNRLRFRNCLIALALVAMLFTAGWTAQLVTSGASLTTAATKFVATLDREQQALAVLPYDAPSRVRWHFVPRNDRKGLQLKDMTAEQRAAALAMLQIALSETGLAKGKKIMALESLLAFLERDRKGGAVRDPERYYFTLFGTPSTEGVWGLSCEGHHLSLNFVVRDNKIVASTPAMLGSNPATVKESYGSAAPPKGETLLAKEEQLAFELVHALSADQQKVAIVDAKAPQEMRGAGDAQPPTAPAVGLKAEAMSGDLQKKLRNLIGVYLDNMSAETAALNWKRIDEAGFEKVHFAWAGATEAGSGHYYRIQGPTFVIELVNTQPDAAGNPANHVHCMWRDMEGDFGIPIKK